MSAKRRKIIEAARKKATEIKVQVREKAGNIDMGEALEIGLAFKELGTDLLAASADRVITPAEALELVGDLKALAAVISEAIED